MMPNIRSIEMPLVTRVTSLFLILLLSCMVRSSLADSLPSFVKSPEDQTGVSGEVASFVCQAMGEPKPRITWKKNGKKITFFQKLEVIEFNNGSGSVLRIQPLRSHRDEGTYECTATNSAGEINTSAKLTVLEEYQIPQGFPTIDIRPQLRVVEETRTATMLCAVSGDPDPEISWYKDMLPVDINSSNSRIKQLPSGTLQIENSEKSDQGKYECLAMNSVGTRYSAPANLYVRVRRSPPRFSILPTNQEVVPGGSVNLTCVAVGVPMPYVKWIMGTEDMTPEDEMPLGRNILEVTNIRESASYTCVAMSSLGMIEATTQVTVKGLPSFISFIKSPEDQTGISGGVVSFVCQATGEPKPRITWKRNGKKVLQRFEVIEFDDGSGSVLRIQPLRAYRDEGIYECIATSSAGETNTSAKLTVLEEDQIPHGFPSFDTSPQLRVVEKSRIAFMHCSASGNPEPEISWYKDMLPVDLNASNGRIKQQHTGSLLIENSEESDQGKYECVAMNSAGTRYSAPANLYVRELREVRKVPPRFSVPPTNQAVMPGESVYLTCVAVGSPMPYVKWTLGTKDLAPEDEMPLGRNVLEMTNIRESANYTCVAMSPLGVIEATAQVTVKEPGKPNMMISTMGNTALIQWAPPKEMVGDLIGYQLQYKRADDENFTSLELRRTDSHYTVTGLHKGATYIFRLSARNRAGIGEANTEEISTEKDVPSGFPINLQVTELTQSSMNLTWEPPLLAEKIIYYMVVYRDINRQQNNTILTTDTHVILQCLNPYTTYDIRVQAYTSKGAGPLSPSIQSRTKPNVLLSWLSFLYDIVK